MEKILYTGEEFKAELLNLIKQAKKNIYISTYIFGYDLMGLEVLNRLIEKAESGVTVHLIVDGFGSWSWLKNLKIKLPHNFNCAVFHPLPWPLGKWSGTHRRSLFFINRRNHHKMVIVDEELAIVGSRNLNDDSIQWRETSALIDGSRVKELLLVFQWTWDHCKRQGLLKKIIKDKRLISRPSFVFTNHNFVERFHRHRTLFMKLKSSKEHIYITTPYFFPPRRFFKILLRKAKQGIDVRILVPQKSDVKASKWIAQTFFRKMLSVGIKIYEYKSEVLHAKTMIIDNWIVLGSSNFNHRSFKRDLEIDIVLKETMNFAEMKANFFVDLQQSHQLDIANWSGPPFWIRWSVFIMLIFSAWF